MKETLKPRHAAADTGLEGEGRVWGGGYPSSLLPPQTSNLFEDWGVGGWVGVWGKRRGRRGGPVQASPAEGRSCRVVVHPCPKK